MAASGKGRKVEHRERESRQNMAGLLVKGLPAASGLMASSQPLQPNSQGHGGPVGQGSLWVKATAG